MRVNIFNGDEPEGAESLVVADVELSSAIDPVLFPEDFRQAEDELRARGRTLVGGGAAHLFLLVLGGKNEPATIE